MLSWSNLVMLSLVRNTKLPKLCIEVLHKLSDSLTDNAEVVILHLLTLGRHCTKKCSSCKDKVLSLHGLIPVNKEVFLLRTNGYVDSLGCSIAKKSYDTKSLLVNCFHGS